MIISSQLPENVNTIHNVKYIVHNIIIIIIYIFKRANRVTIIVDIRLGFT